MMPPALLNLVEEVMIFRGLEACDLECLRIMTEWLETDVSHRLADLDPAPALVERELAKLAVRCGGCGLEIDPGTCGCGDSLQSHSNPMIDGHFFVPAGCSCYSPKN